MIYIVKRGISALLILFLVSLLVFSIVHMIPGDPAVMMLGQEASAESLAQLRADLGLDQPLSSQYFSWLSSAISGDFGQSVSINQPVSKVILERLPATISLTLASTLVAVIIGLTLGIIAAVKHNTSVDAVASLVAFAGISIPQFWLGILLIYFFSLKLGLLPPGGYVDILENPGEGLRRLVLPALALGTTLAALLSRMTRSSMLEVYRQDYVRTARSKGLWERNVIRKHALKNALIPTVTVIGIQMGYLIGSAIVIEEIFYWPGLGRLVLHAVNYRDLPLLQGVTMVIAFAYVGINLVVDLVYTALDPRIRFS